MFLLLLLLLLMMMMMMMEFSILGLKHIYIKDKEAQVDELDGIYVKKKKNSLRLGTSSSCFPPETESFSALVVLKV